MRRLQIAFFCTGFAALVCQVVWQRMLGVFAGSDTVSAALVVGAFLTGLGLGSILGAKLADRLPARRALLGFALCEAGVAVFALLSKPFLYDLLAVRLAGVVDAPAAVFALCFAGLVVPTTLMGASLPLLARAIATSLDTLAEQIGRLYGLNTLGAGLGALAGGWLILGNLGFVGALVLAAGLELLGAALAVSLLPSLRRGPAPVPRPVGADVAASAAASLVAASGPAEPFGGLRLWCLLVFLSGYVIVALEIVWVRVLGQAGQFHAYLFPTVLGVFLLADGLGMAVAARLVRGTRDPRPAFFKAQGGGFVLAAALVLALWIAAEIWPASVAFSPERERTGPLSLLATTLTTLTVVGPPSFLIGMTFPFVQRAVQHDLASVGARVGWVQLANIAGNAAGSVLTGLVTLHLLGTAGTLRLLAALSLALLLGWLLLAGWRRRGAEVVLAAACAAALLALPSNTAFWRRLHAPLPGAPAAWAEDRSGVAFWRDGARAPDAPPGPFFIAGYAQGHVPFLSLHMLLGAVGPLLHPDPERVLLIGVGSGGTPWGATVSPTTQEVRAIEIVGPVLEVLGDLARARPDGAAAALLADPRLRLEVGDGRRALVRATEQYDVIEADAILPTGSHSGLLYSREFMEAVRRRLAPGGLYVQWAPTWRVVDTFAAVFPHVVLLRPAHVLVGSDRPVPHDPAALAARLRNPAVVAHVRRGNPDARPDLSPLVSDPPLVWRPGDPRGGDVLTDMFPRDEFFMNNPRRTTPMETPKLHEVEAARRP
jgi:spermidine synthase